MSDRAEDHRDRESDTGPMEGRLAEERPIPPAGFRSSLERGLDRLSRRLPSGVVMRRWALICVIVGAVLLAIAVIAVAGAGPLATD